MKIFLTLIVFVIVFIAFVRYVEQTGIFYPSKALSATPEDFGIPYEDVIIPTEDRINVHGWLTKSPSAQTTLIFFHGNAGNIGDRLDKIDLFHQMGVNVLIVDYRGYGRSEGKPTERGIYLDATAAYDYLLARDDMKGQKIISYGASLGGVVSIDLATKRGLNGIIVDSTFSSAADIAKRIYPFIPSFLIQTKMDSLRKIKDINIPKLFIHSIEDRTVPFELGKKLYEAAPEPKKMIKIVGDHNDSHILSEEKIREEIKSFLTDLDLI